MVNIHKSAHNKNISTGPKLFRWSMVVTSPCLKIHQFSNKIHRRNKQSWISDGKTKATFWTLNILYPQFLLWVWLRGWLQIWEEDFRTHQKEVVKGILWWSCSAVLWFLLVRSALKSWKGRSVYPIRISFRFFWCTVQSDNPPKSMKEKLLKDNGPVVVDNSSTRPACWIMMKISGIGFDVDDILGWFFAL